MVAYFFAANARENKNERCGSFRLYNAHVRFGLPLWFFKVLAAVGGFGFLFQQVVKPLVVSLMNFLLNHRDEPIWEILCHHPKFKPISNQGNRTFYSTDEVPYSADELAEQIGRSVRSTNRSLHRLEKRGKVKEVKGGWQRKEK